MTNALLDKARAILAHPKLVPSPKLKPLEDEDNKAPVIEPAVRPPSPKDIEIEPAAKPDGSPLSPIYWETGDGRIIGPAVPEFFLRDGDEYWISVTFEEHIRFIRDDRLRSRKTFLEQNEVREVELIRF
ncbi:hypothetical protein YTPLAS72_21410 [Nitrospira sp.]|nr:hypothetical protein YTPLAS72_21410 [Nitrospira sp.]